MLKSVVAILLTASALIPLAASSDLAMQNRHTLMRLQQVVMEQNERIDGLTSLIEGLNVQIAQLKEGQRHTTSSPDNNETVALLKELGAMIDKINSTYVSKAELKRILGSKMPETVKSGSTASPKQPSLSQTAPAKLYSEGVRLFVKKRYDEAQKRFAITAKKGYKPAASNYYLGEIAYYTKRYDDALFYYKKSASLYDQASYMDVLILHTAISLEKTGQKEEAKVFFQNVIDSYPDTKAAAIAKKRLKVL